MSGRGKRIVLGLLVILLCYALAVGTLMGADTVRRDEGMDEILYMPNEKLLVHFTGGLNSVIADLLWLHCIQYTAREHKGQRHFTWLEHMLLTVTRLDPHFVDAYRYGAMFLSALRADPDASLRLARAGMAANPNAWQLPYEAAMNYLMNKREEPNSRYFAAQYISMSVATGRAPGGIANLAAKLQGEFDLLEIEHDVWRDMLDSEDTFIRDLAARKLEEIRLREIGRVLNESLARFEAQEGRAARSLEELVERELITHIPDDPLGGDFFLGSDGVAYNSSLLEEQIIRARDILINALDRYKYRYEAWPPTLDTLVAAGVLEDLPVHPHPGATWQYDPATGLVE